jgi:hypothetical protein
MITNQHHIFSTKTHRNIKRPLPSAALKQEDPKQQRSIETSLKRFMAHLRDAGNSPATQQVAYAAVRSFFEMHFLPLRMRRGDYPTGDSNGQRAATKDAIRRVLANSKILKNAEDKTDYFFLIIHNVNLHPASFQVLKSEFLRWSIPVAMEIFKKLQACGPGPLS